ncbi:unnamed protein product [Phaedon cochleariae]|uniref:Tesmin/TSO1-like CXC domain-containing protein n=1 Tax=Phaedon cochleariae TaxID=80249 RepID=A0A9N9SAA4_PHACE|nr:unnamed protein product [Phaedon cochleariae]
MASSTEAGLCFICQNSLAEGEVNVVKAKGVARLLDSSVKRKKSADEQFLKNLKQVTVHSACQKKYNNEGMIKASLRRGHDAPRPSLRSYRSERAPFDFNNRCFLCEDVITDEYRKRQAKLPIDRRNGTVKVTLREVANTILAYAQKRGDEWGQKIEDRVSQLNNLNTDLVAVNAEYHQKCLQTFYQLPSRVQKRGHCPATYVDEAMEIIFKFLEDNSEECQFSVGQLLDLVPEDCRPHPKTLKRRLEGKYGDDIIISDSPNRECIICFKNTGHKILSDNWYVNEKKGDPKEERLRVVKTAGKIILEDIRSKMFSTVAYPPIDNFLGDSHSVVPETLLLLLHTIILTNKRSSMNSWKIKCLALAHAILIAVRPRSFLSSIMIAVATYVYKKFGSRHLLNLLATLGFSAPYTEATRLEGSYVLQAERTEIDESVNPFSQFIFDNADFNVNTLDGHGTFHAMGGIMAVTPRKAVTYERDVARLKAHVSASDLVNKAGSVRVESYHRPTNGGLKTVKVKDINISSLQDVVPSASDVAWLYGKNSSFSSSVPGWNGFMELGTHSEKYECSKIVCLPFINAPPSEYATVYTSILVAIGECKALNQKTCVVTYDQPLYWKARDVVANNSFPELNSVVVRLGGFHLLMSFMGAMGTIMAGSGLKELFCMVYAGNSVDKILSGHAYARAIRSHFLTHAALAGLIIERLELTPEEVSALDTVINSPERSIILRAHRDPVILAVTDKFSAILKKIENSGRTARLWIQYFRMCTLMKNYIQAERMGDWNLHLECVRDMIPYFHAAGHLNYAKSAHLYLQDMLSLEMKMDPDEYHKFTTEGYFTIRRTDKFWSGIWSDMTIEQVLMRAMKSYGGLTRGRGVTDSVLSRWIVGMLCLQHICDQIEMFTDVRSATSEQHVDMRPSRVTRDNVDIEKLRSWFAEHPPFLEIEELVSLSTGAIADEGVNCHMAREIGISCMKKMVGENFEEVKLKRKNKVLTLASVSSVLKIKNKKFTVDPLTLFQRVCITKQSAEDLNELFRFELAPFPMSLFSEEGMMRKGKKSALYEAFTSVKEEYLGSRKCAVIDGGYLLHKVVWVSGCDTTSNPFGVGKKKVLSIYEKNHFLSDIVSVFKDEDATPRQISVAGEKFLVALYGGNIDTDTVDDLRYRIFSNSVAKSRFHLARLPPTRDAARYHSFRTYLQVQTWLGNEKSPSVWGWTLTKRGLIPITTTTDAAPEKLLHMIQCKCTTGCSTGACSCKKAGLRCSAICKNCAGNACENSPETELKEEDTDIECDEEVDMDETIAQDEDADLPLGTTK